MEVTACIVTRGDHPLDAILESLPPKWELEVYDNSQEPHDLSVYGRYEAIGRAKTDVVFVQDDDCVLAPDSFRKLERNYQEGVITANMPMRFREHYSDSCLIGFGAIFDRYLPDRAFGKLPYYLDESMVGFDRTCDVYFTAITHSFRFLDLAYADLPWATGPDRMYRQKTHVGERKRALEHARTLR